MRPGNNPVEKVKAEKDGLDILEEIRSLPRTTGAGRRSTPATGTG